MKMRDIYTAVAVIGITIVTIGFISWDDLEYQHVTSDDGVVTIEGEWLSTTEVTIKTLAQWHYQLSPDITFSPEPLQLSFNTQLVGTHGFSPYRYDSTVHLWEDAAVSSMENGEYVILTNNLGEYALLDTPEVEAPDFVSYYDELLEMAPETTVGFELMVGVVLDDGRVIRLSEQDQLGGCGGIIRQANGYEVSELTHEARVFVDDVETLMEFRFIGLWLVDESGCAEGEELVSVL